MENQSNLNSIPVEKNFDFSRHTTYGAGGKCKVAYFPKTEGQAAELFKELSGQKEKFFVLGRGSNILASDAYYNGSVISTQNLNGIKTVKDAIICQSGVTVSQLLKFCQINGLSGLEFLAGIPASVGGLTLMNAGAGGKYISDVLIGCTVFDGKLRNFLNKSCNFGYKYSTMHDINCIILSSVFKVERTSGQYVENNISKYLKNRSLQPKGKSCGCVFKNPEGYSAGKLIEECGLKGYRLGGAEVSRAHANFIINNRATAQDIYNVIQYVKSVVFNKFGIMLNEEVVYIGEFNDTDC